MRRKINIWNNNVYCKYIVQTGRRKKRSFQHKSDVTTIKWIALVIQTLSLWMKSFLEIISSKNLVSNLKNYKICIEKPKELYLSWWQNQYFSFIAWNDQEKLCVSSQNASCALKGLIHAHIFSYAKYGVKFNRIIASFNYTHLLTYT